MPFQMFILSYFNLLIFSYFTAISYRSLNIDKARSFVFEHTGSCERSDLSKRIYTEARANARALVMMRASLACYAFVSQHGGRRLC